MNQDATLLPSGSFEIETRAKRLRALLGELLELRTGVADKFRALALLISDAGLESDEEALVAGHRGLQRLYAQQLAAPEPTAEELVARGRTLALLDVVDSTSRRVTPLSALKRLRRGRAERHFLELLAEEQSLTDAQLSDALALDRGVVADMGRRLREAGAVSTRTLGGERRWDITPRGRDALLVRLNLRLDARRVRGIARQVLEPVAHDGGSQNRRRPVTSAIMAALVSADHPMTIDELVADTRHPTGRVKLGVSALLDRGVLRYGTAGAEESFAVREGAYCAIGVEVLPGRLMGVVTDLRGKRLRTDEQSLSDMRPESVADAIAEIVARLRTPADGTNLPPELLGLGIELGGHIDGTTGEVVLSANLRVHNKPWRRVALGSLVSSRTGLRTVVENDADSLAILQQLFGHLADEAEEFGVIMVGDGVGSGLIVRGEVVHGAQGLAGEIGHLVINPGGRECGCGHRGCLEAYAAVPGILAACAEPDGSGRPQTLDEAAARAARGDARAQAAFRDAGDALGRGIAAIQNLLNPREILVAVPAALGPLSDPPVERAIAAQLFTSALRTTAADHSFSTARSDIHVLHIPQLAEYGALGAAAALLRRFVELPLQWPAVETSPTLSRGARRRAERDTPRVDVDAEARLMDAFDHALAAAMT